VKHLANLVIVNDQHKLSLLSHRALYYALCAFVGPRSRHEDSRAAKAWFQQILLRGENLPLFNLADVVLKLEQHVARVKMFYEKSPELNI
jgi:hypothetical protein